MSSTEASLKLESDMPAAGSEESPMKGAGITVALLTLLYAVSYVDRSILALLALPVSQSLALDDRQLALLLGVGFALFYAVGGLVLAHFVDTRNRRIVVTAGVVVWSLSTILSGFANGFWMMLILRSGVALGEAVLTPAAISLIADLYPRHRRGMPVAIFSSVAGVMAIGSYAVGAAAMDLAARMSGHTGLDAWRMTFIFVGLPGLLLAAIFVLIATVPTRREDRNVPVADADIRVVFTYLRARFGFFGPLLSLTGLNSLYSLAIIAWLPALLAREQGLSPSSAGYLIGLVGVPAGLVGNFFWQWIATRKQVADPTGGIVRTFRLPALVAAPAFAAGLMTDSLVPLLCGFGVGMFFSTAFSVVSPLSIQLFGPPQMRGRVSSIYLLIVAVLGYGLAPLAAVELGAAVAGEGHGLREGLVILSLLVWPVLIWMSFRVAGKTHLVQIQ